MFGLSQASVDTTIVGGKVLMEGGRLELDLDEAEVAARAREQGEGAVGAVLKTGRRAPGAGHRTEQAILVQGGTVWTPDGPRRADVRVVGETIAEIGALTPGRRRAR